MMRIRESQSVNKILMNVLSNNEVNEFDKKINPVFNFSKKELWQKFLETFYNMFGKNFIHDEYTINNLKVLFYYFLKDDNFYKCDNLRGDIIKPSFGKGLLIIGGFGLGKTDYFKVFEKVFEKFNNYRFKFYSSKELVTKYELSQTPFDKKYFFKDISRKRMFIDDIASERIASNYGKFNVIEEVLSHRYDNKLLTFASCNYLDKNQDVKTTIEELGVKYGSRIYDRLFENFNIIEFTGKSYRGR
jgi:DNA replication protein DnaC